MSGQQHNVSERLASLETSQQGLVEDVHRIAQAVEKLGDEFGKRSETPWRTLAAWASVTLAVVALAFTPFLKDLGRLETAAIRSYERELVDAREDGRFEERVWNLEKNLKKN